MTANISVIICAYTEDRWNDLVAAVESVQRQSTPPEEIIVVIDHNPGLLERVRTHIPGVVVVENREPRGLSGARNTGVAVAQGEILAFLDDDAVAAPDWLARLGSCFRDAKVMGAGGVVEPMWQDARPAWFPEEFYWVVGCSYKGLPPIQTSVRNLFGGCMCIRREVFEVVGGFRTGVGRSNGRPMGCEETELCIRAHQYWPERIFLYEPRAWAYHHVPISRARWAYFRARCFAEGLSKAQVVRFVGAKDGLASERIYVLWTLTRGLTRGLVDTVFHHDSAGLVRAGAIVAGFTFTTLGFLVGTVSQWFTGRQEMSDQRDAIFNNIM